MKYIMNVILITTKYVLFLIPYRSLPKSLDHGGSLDRLYTVRVLVISSLTGYTGSSSEKSKNTTSANIMTTFAYGAAGIPYRVIERTESTITLATPKGAMKRPLSDVLGTIELIKGMAVCLIKATAREYVFLQEFKAPTEFKDGVQEYEDWVYLQSPDGRRSAWKLNQIRPAHLEI